MADLKEAISSAMKNIGRVSETALTKSDKCPKCGGCGKIKVPTINDYTRMVYGNDYSIPTDFWEDCPDCRKDRVTENTDLTNVPKQYHDADLSKFSWRTYKNEPQAKKIHTVVSNFFQNFEEWEKVGKGIYFWSKTSGSGKTFLACCLAKSVMIRYDVYMRFITVPDYFNLLLRRKDNPYGFDESSIYRNARLLVLDEVGATPNKEWYESELYRLINYRMNNGLVTIFTSNAEITELNISDRVIDRISKGALPVHFPEEPIRRQKAEEENKAFMEKMGMI